MAVSNEAQTVNESVWYYEEGRHLDFVVRVQDDAYTDPENRIPIKNGTVQFTVPAYMLERSLARLPRKRVRRKRNVENR